MSKLITILFVLSAFFSFSASVECSSITLTLNTTDIHNVNCDGSVLGTITFTVTNGVANNLYRIRKKNVDGTFTTITSPTYTSIGNALGETKSVTVSNLAVGEYDLYVFCSEDPTQNKAKTFTISKDACDPTVNYTCTDLSLTVNVADIQKVSCNDSTNGSFKFTVAGGFASNTYRLRKINGDGTYTVVSNPTFKSIGNLAGETKTTTINGLRTGNYELFVYCAKDATVYKSKTISIGKETCGVISNYNCSSIGLTFNDTDVHKVSCEGTNDGSFSFTVTGGLANNVYRLRKLNSDGTYSTLTNPVFKSLNNIDGESKTVTINSLTTGQYELYVYCNTDPTFFKAKVFTIGKTSCCTATVVKNGLVGYYPFNGNTNDESGNKKNGKGDNVTLSEDRFGNANSAYLFDGKESKITISNLVDFDTCTSGFSYSFWIKHINLPSKEATILSLNNKEKNKPTKITIDKNGTYYAYFGDGNKYKKIKFDTKSKKPSNEWINITVTHDNSFNSIYYDGEIVVKENSSSISENVSEFILGQYESVKKGEAINCILDEVKIYSRAITLKEAETIFVNEVKEDCNGISMVIDTSSSSKKLIFTVSNGSANNKYRIRRYNADGTYTPIYNPAYVDINNELGESVTLTVTDLPVGIYDLYAYCGADSKFYDGYSFKLETESTGRISLRFHETHNSSEELNVTEIFQTESNIDANIYPNPAIDYINLQLFGLETDSEFTIRVISSTGQIFLNEIHTRNTLTSSLINVQNWESGSYFLEINFSDKAPIKKKFVVK
jgi:hypothetical protein